MGSPQAAGDVPKPGLPAWLWVLALALLAHASGLGGAYVLDDHHAIVAHPVVQGDAPWHEVFTREWFGKPLGESWSSSYRPISTLSFVLVARLGGGSLAQHLVNLSLYGGLCVAVLFASRRVLSDRAALVCALAFAACPLHVENVAALVGRADLLAMLFALAAWVLLDPDPRTPNPAPARAPNALHRVALGCAAFWLAMLCKESVALLPGLIIWRTMVKSRRGEATRAHWLAAAAIAFTGIAYIVPRQLLLPVGLPESFNAADNLLRGAGAFDRVWGGLAVWGQYLSLGLRAAPLCADHTWGDMIPPGGMLQAGAGYAWLGLAAALVALADTVHALRTGRGGLFALAAASALLVGHFALPLSVILAERLALWPGLFVLWAFVDLAERALAPGAVAERLRTPATLAFAVLCTFWAARSAQRSLDWSDDLRLGRSSLLACPAALHARVNLAGDAARAGLAEEALWHYAVSATLRPQFPQAPHSPVFAIEAQLGLTHPRAAWASALPGLPAQLEVADARAFWSQLAALMQRQGQAQAADLALQLATEPTRPPTSPSTAQARSTR